MSRSRTTARRTVWALSAAVLVGPLAACSGSADTGASGGVTAVPSTTVTAGPTTATGPASSLDASPTGETATDRTGETDPTDVATDTPVGVEPGTGLDVVVSFVALEPGGRAVEASGSLPGLIEDGGRCVLVLSREGRDDVSAEVPASADAQSTSCGLLSVPVDRLSPGTWTARLDYRSAGSSGSSADVTVDVP